jgi:hypothetical protein
VYNIEGKVLKGIDEKNNVSLESAQRNSVKEERSEAPKVDVKEVKSTTMDPTSQ